MLISQGHSGNQPQQRHSRGQKKVKEMKTKSKASSERDAKLANRETLKVIATVFLPALRGTCLKANVESTNNKIVKLA